MNCVLCGKVIANYNAEFNCLKLDASVSVNICNECIDKFIKWQGSVFTKLFPRKALNKNK